MLKMSQCLGNFPTLVASMLTQEAGPAFWPRFCSCVEQLSEEVIPKIREEN